MQISQIRLDGFGGIIKVIYMKLLSMAGISLSYALETFITSNGFICIILYVAHKHPFILKSFNCIKHLRVCNIITGTYDRMDQ